MVDKIKNGRQINEDILRAHNIIPPFDTEKQPAEQQTAEKIPKFDLAEEILAQHRKKVSVRRKAPSLKNSNQLEQSHISRTVHKDIPSFLSPQDKIIADIVARDIERLCSGNNEK